MPTKTDTPPVVAPSPVAIPFGPRGLPFLTATALLLAPGSVSLAQQNEIPRFAVARVDELPEAFRLAAATEPTRWVLLSGATLSVFPSDQGLPVFEPSVRDAVVLSSGVSESFASRLAGLPPLTELLVGAAGAADQPLPPRHAQHTVRYTYDPLGRLTESLGRLTESEASDGTLNTTGYDPAGNRTSTSFQFFNSP